MYAIVKRIMDFSMAIALLIALSPLFAVICCLVLLFEGRPVFFRQLRPGQHEQPFEILKFRTMASLSGRDVNEDFQRITRLGRILRRSSLDELPNLINVVKGDMSFVGPRPLLEPYLEIYSDYHRLRHLVRPGMTGLAQVAGRNLLTWKHRLDLDLYYVENLSLLLDIKILFQSLNVVIRMRGINRADGSPMAELTKGYELD